MILLDVKTESIVQSNDQFRVDCSLSGDVEKLEIGIGSDEFKEFYNGEDLLEKHCDLYLEEAGEVELSVRATAGEEARTITKSITVLGEDEDRLFSSDQDLLLHEEAVHELLRPGKLTFKNIHRLAQQEILRDLRERFPDADLSKNSLVEIDQVRAWSKCLVLYYIFESNVRSVDDIHVEKARTYKDLAEVARRNIPLKLDTDGDGKEDLRTNLGSMRLTL